jgi:hypothetical protein
MPKDFKIVFVNEEEIGKDDDVVVSYFIKTDPSNFNQREKKLKLMKDSYIMCRDALVGSARTMCRLITHSNRKDVQLLVKDELVSCDALRTKMDLLEFLIQYDESPYARKIINDLAKIDILKEINNAVEEEMKFSTVTNNDIYEQSEKHKDEIIQKLHEIFEKHNEKPQPNIIKNLIDAGQLKQERDSKTGKYIALKSPYDFLCWCFEHGYADDINFAFVAEHIKTNCNLETLKKYEREARDVTETKQKSYRIYKNR